MVPDPPAGGEGQITESADPKIRLGILRVGPMKALLSSGQQTNLASATLELHFRNVTGFLLFKLKELFFLETKPAGNKI
jgi:hypothetical protein